MRIDRRRALAILGLGAATSPAMAADLYKGPVDFIHGVGSGDPLANQVILWTRITAQELTAAEIAYSWTITPAAGGKALTGTGVTGPGRDYTVKIDVAGLVPATDYVFSFEANGTSSPKGQTRTLPVGKTKEVVMAVASCSLYPNGYFNAYGAIAALDKVDVVIHLGDYIYEYG
jgi:alkaline phosphatase D